MTILFISDLHLDESHPKSAEHFFNFLQTQAASAEALYILGDLFEVWVGDDHVTPISQQVCQALQALKQTGTAIYLMHGNRDFLLGERFAQASGCTILPDPTIIELYGIPTLLMHGDTLCTADMAYLAFRQQVREPAYQQTFLAKPLDERIAIAQQLRKASFAHQQAADAMLLDVTPAEIPNMMRKYQVLQLIHGHTHRPAIHYFNLDNKLAKRFVLSDWHLHGNALVCTPSHLLLIDV